MYLIVLVVLGVAVVVLFQLVVGSRHEMAFAERFPPTSPAGLRTGDESPKPATDPQFV